MTYEPAPHCLLLWLRCLVSLGPLHSFISGPHPTLASLPQEMTSAPSSPRKQCCLEGTPSTSRPALAAGLSASPPILPASPDFRGDVCPVLTRASWSTWALSRALTSHPRISFYHLLLPPLFYYLPLPTLLAPSPQSINKIGSSCFFRKKEKDVQPTPPFILCPLSTHSLPQSDFSEGWFILPVSASSPLSHPSLSSLAVAPTPSCVGVLSWTS